MATAFALHQLPPFLLLLHGEAGPVSSFTLTLAIFSAFLFSAAHSWVLIHARQKLLDQLAEAQRPIDQIALPKLNDDPWLIANAWTVSAIGSVSLAMTILRPTQIPPLTALTLGLFAAVLLAASSLPLLMLVRRDFVRVMECVPPDIMGDIIDAQVRSGRLRGRTSRRLLAAIVAPVAFLALGSALIAGAHVRAANEISRETIAREVITATLLPRADLAPSSSARSIGLAQAELARMGFRTQLDPTREVEAQKKLYQDLVSLNLPLPPGSVEVEFVGSTVWPISQASFFLALFALLAAGAVGIALGRFLSRDLKMANHGVRLLGTDAALEGTRVMRPARFRAVAELGSSIELLASRFRLFAQAQQRSIEAREAATRSRGRFFASVSHDLKSPLNAILGFAEITHNDPKTNAQQRESLELILQRGRELLALIETILDAARIEAGQLTLERTEEPLETLLDLAIDKAQDLSHDAGTRIVVDAPADLPTLVVDRLRFSQALATFIGHARRTSERHTLRVLVEVERKAERPSLARRKIHIFVEIPSTRFSAQELEALLIPERQPGQHRGLALALRLAKSIIELHGGQVTITGRTVREPAFAIQLRTRPGR